MEEYIININTNYDYNNGDKIYNINNSKNGLLISYLNKKYIITTHYGITNYSKDTYNSILLKNKIIVPEIDIVIYDINDIVLDKEYYKMDDNSYNINHIDDKTKLLLDDINVNIIEMTKDKYNNPSYPYMLKYIGKSDNKKWDNYNGYPIVDNKNNIIGIFCGGGDYLHIIPFFYIKRILDEYNKYGKFNGFCHFYHNIENNIILNNSNIKYNLDKKTKYLNKGDYIELLDGKKVENDLIFCDIINIPIDIDGYISITKTVYDVNEYSIYRRKNKSKKYILVTINNILSKYNLDINDDCNKIVMKKDNIYLKINPLLFEHLIKFIDIDRKLINIFNNKCKNNSCDKYLLIKNNKYNIYDNKINKKYIIINNETKL